MKHGSRVFYLHSEHSKRGINCFLGWASMGIGSKYRIGLKHTIQQYTQGFSFFFLHAPTVVVKSAA